MAVLAAGLVTLTLLGIPNCSSPDASWGSASVVLRSADGAVQSTIPFGPQWIKDPHAASLSCMESSTSKGYDAIGVFEYVSHWWMSKPSAASNGQVRTFFTGVKIYSDKRTLAFSQAFLDPPMTNLSSGNTDGVVTAFPSLEVTTQGTPLGYAHLAGYMAGNSPQYGTWSSGAASASLAGGIQNSGVVILFDQAASTSLVISPSSSFMAASLAVRKDNTSGRTYCDFGVMGGVDTIPGEFSAEWIMVAAPQGPSDAVREWGKVLRTKYNRQSEEESHNMDLTTRVLGYGTDNGAYYYYYTGANASKTYDDVLREVKAYATAENLPYKYIELDSWWYYRQDGADKAGVPLSGVTNWTAMPSVLPEGGLPGAFNITQWPVMAHNRYFATNNVYASNPLQPIGPTLYDGPTFNFSWGYGAGLPASEDFWDSLFAMNNNWGLTVYLQDWLSMTTASMPQVVQDVHFGRKWLRDMGAGAAKHNLTIQYCMSFPRHVLQALEIPSVTQARASEDYQPQTNLFAYNQWAIGESSLWVSAIGLVPSKDNFWTMTTPQYTPHYDPFFMTRETRCRLESVAASMSNGPVLISDRVGYSNRTLIMKACDANGRLLRPATSAGPLDAYFVARAFLGATAAEGRLHATWSLPGLTASAHAYVLSVNMASPRNLTAADLPEVVKSAIQPNGDSSGWFVYEANTTDTLQMVTATQPYLLSASDEWSFQYLTFAPIPTFVAKQGSGWVFIGEQEKHIAASQLRFPAKSHDAVTGDIHLVVDGAVDETVTVAFADYASQAISRTSCVLLQPQMTLTWFANGTSVCARHP